MTMAFRCAGLRGVSVLLVLAGCWLSCAGCVQTAALWANITGGDVIEPEYTLTRGPLLVLIDDRDSSIAEPQAIRHVHKTISDAFLQYGINRQVVPFADWQTLQRTAKDYDRLSVRQIGEKLGADQVLYLRVDRFTLRGEPGAPLFKGEFAVRVKVLSTERQSDIRLWPREEAGRSVLATTHPVPADGDQSAGDVSRELAENLGWAVTKLFYEHRALDK